MPTDPLTSSRYPAASNAPNVPQDIQNAVFDLAENTVTFYSSTTARDTAYTNWVASGGVMREGLVSWIAGVGFTVYRSGAWQTVLRSVVRAVDWTSGGVTSATTQSSVAAETITVTNLDVLEGRRIGVLVRGNFGTGTASPYVGAKVDGANLDADEFEVRLEGKTSWFFVGAPVASAGNKAITVYFRSHTGGTNVSAGNVKVIYQVF